MTSYNELMRRALAVLCVSCATNAPVGPSPEGGPSDTGIADVGPVDAPSFDDAGDAPPPPACAIDKVYMLSWSNTLYQFDPGKLTFTKSGVISCFPTSFSAFSMAVDRQGIAWIEGWVFGPPLVWYLKNVSTVDATCSGSLTVVGSPNFETAGGGETFVTDTPTGPSETLYSVALTGSSGGGSTFGVSTINTSTGAVAPIGGLNTDPSSGISITGTGDARMFAAESPASSGDGGTNIIFTQRDKSNAGVLSTANVTIPANYIVVGVVFWGGDFWFFLRPTVAAPWQIGRYDPLASSFAIEVTDVGTAVGETGFGLTAVAISTCAPLTPPK